MSLTDVTEKSLDEIAGGLLVNAEGEQPDPPSEPEAEQPELELDDTAEAEVDTQETLPDEGEPDDEAVIEDEPDEPEVDDEPEEIVDLYTVKIDGQTRQVTIEEMQRLASGNGAIDKRLQEATELRKQAEAQIVEANQLRDAYAAALEQAQAQPDLIPEPDPALYEQDPAEWARQRELWRTAREQRDQKQQELAALRAQQQQEFAQQQQLHLREEMAKLTERIPDMADAQKAQVKRQRYIELANQFGYSSDEVNGVTDHRVFVLLDRLAELEDAAKGAKQAVKRARKARPTIRPGAAKSQVSQSKKRQDALAKRARDTGHPDDVAALLLQPRGG